jgi:two-component system phosphate regulon sensor histidine kinase PhoR
MKKRLALINSLIIAVSLFILLLCSSLILQNENKKASERSLSNYLSLSIKVLDKNCAFEDTSKAIPDMCLTVSGSNPSLRVTVISLEGIVVYDTSADSDGMENHKTRPEIEDLGSIQYRWSATLKKNMMYLAGLNGASTYYVRVSMPQYDVQAVVSQTILYGSLACLGVLILSIAADIYLTNRALAPLKVQADKLGRIVGQPIYQKKKDEIDMISEEIDSTRELIDSKISSITEEKDKLRFVLDSINEGLIVCDSDLKCLTVNKKALALFGKSEAETLEKPLVCLCFNPELNQAAEKAAGKKESSSFEYLGTDGKTYLAEAYPLSEPWCSKGDRFGAGIFLADITSEKTLAAAKRDFFANASHELKSPLTSIIGYSEIIRSGMASSPAEEKADLERILFEAKRMNEIIIEMLKLSELESESGEPVSEVISVRKSAEAVVSELKEEAGQMKVSLSLEGNDFLARIRQDDLESLLRNLAENAIKYNKEGGRASILISGAERKITVQDTGIGIAEADQERVFERFYRVDKARSKKLGGTGLGLSIVKHICLLYGIEIKLESALGQGSSFTLAFPK